MKMTLQKEKFIEKAEKIHNNKYDYSLVEYKNNRIKINDDIKNRFADESNIKLIRIPYTEFKNIENILRSNLIVSI